MEWMCGHIHFLQNVEKMFNKGIVLNQFEVYQTMLDKGFSVKAIASIFSVSEELIKKILA
jgi:uncharacterized protein YktA (UPF0223 family)